jgi:hypothetical protein
MSQSKFKFNDPEFQKDFDNKKYTVEISDEELSKYSEVDYKENEKKMNIHLLCQVSEQRCKPYFCSYCNCVSGNNDGKKCYKLYYLMNKCIENERKKVIYQYINTGVQPMT